MPKRLNNRQRLALHMDTRRADLRLRWADVATTAGVSTETLRQIRQGTGDIRTLTKRGIEEALLWEAGSVDAILDGREPAIAVPPSVREVPAGPNLKILAAAVGVMTEEEAEEVVSLAHERLAEIRRNRNLTRR